MSRAGARAVVVTVLLLPGCGDGPLSPRDARALDAAEARWAARGFTDYAFVTRRSCFCAPEALIDVEIEVRDGTIAAVTDAAADTLLPTASHGTWYTVDDLFAVIRRASGTEAVEHVRVVFDSVLGFPREITVTYDPGIADAGGTWVVTRLEALPPAAGLTPLLPGFDWRAWFTAATGDATHPDHFGAYGIAPAGGTLYLGFGAALPAQQDGALLAAFDARGLHSAVALDEQGFLDLSAVGDTLLIPGVDPCCPDGWEFGNFYAGRTGAALVKRRNLPWVLHGWGIWHDTATALTWLAVSSHLGDSVTLTGEIWRTPDLGLTWTRVATRDDGVGGYRTYDVAGHGGRLYAVAAEFGGCTLVAAPETGTVWTPVAPADSLACIHRLVRFGRRLLALDVTRRAVLVVDAGGALQRHALPFTVGPYTLHWATEAAGRLFAVADDGGILRTADLVDWTPVAAGDGRAYTGISYWPYRRWLVLGERGGGGGPWRLRLCGVGPC